MNILDILVIAIVIGFTIASAAWGLIRQVIALGGLILGMVLAGMFSSQLANLLGFVSDPVIARGVAYMIIIIGVSLIASVIASVLYFMANLLFLGWLDALLGAALGFLQGWLAVGVLLVGAVVFFQTWTTEQLQQSFIASKVFGLLSQLALIFAPEDLKSLFRLTSNKL
ncbi:MAG: CvpA family protein [Chloroflexi bacterium]|nr:CvpA family protein [Chloroflexota bacterium]